MRTYLRGEPILDRIEAQLARGEANACWPFTGRKDRDGYGRISKGRADYAVHRVMLETRLGRPLEPSELALHSCDSPPCCNPAHLFAGTIADNNRDKAAKGRAPRGEVNGAAKLTEEQAKEIIRLRADGYSALGLAKRFGVTDRTIYYVAKGQKWAHLSPEARP